MVLCVPRYLLMSKVAFTMLFEAKERYKVAVT